MTNPTSDENRRQIFCISVPGVYIIRRGEEGSVVKKIKFINAGLFVSNGKGSHCRRLAKNNELIFVKSGVLGICENGKKYSVKSNEFLILETGREHYGTEEYKKDLCFFWGHFEGGAEELKNCPNYGVVLRPGFFTEYFSMLINEQYTPDNQRTCDLLMQILLNETRRKPKNDNTPVQNSFLADKAKKIISLKFASKISSRDIAAELNCNCDYLGRVFHKAFGCSMLEYLNDLRCREAAYLLRESNASVKEIAYSVGFDDMTYFRRRFFKVFLMTPSRFRGISDIKRVNTMNI